MERVRYLSVNIVQQLGQYPFEWVNCVIHNYDIAALVAGNVCGVPAYNMFKMLFLAITYDHMSQSWSWGQINGCEDAERVRQEVSNLQNRRFWLARDKFIPTVVSAAILVRANWEKLGRVALVYSSQAFSVPQSKMAAGIPARVLTNMPTLQARKWVSEWVSDDEREG